MSRHFSDTHLGVIKLLSPVLYSSRDTCLQIELKMSTIPLQVALQSRFTIKCFFYTLCAASAIYYVNIHKVQRKIRQDTYFLDNPRRCSIQKYLTAEYHCYLLSHSFWLCMKKVPVRSTILVSSSLNDDCLVATEPRQNWTLAPKQKNFQN